MAEISDAELAELTQARTLLKSLYDDSAVGFEFRKIVKKKYPSASIPELQAIEKTEELGTGLTKKVEEMSAGAMKKIDDFLAARAKEKEETDVDKFAERINSLAKTRGYTKEGTEKLLTLMKERGIQNPEDAAVIFEASQPKAPKKPVQFSSRMQFVSPDSKDDEAFNKLMSDPDQFMVDEMLTAIGNANQEE